MLKEYEWLLQYIDRVSFSRLFNINSAVVFLFWQVLPSVLAYLHKKGGQTFKKMLGISSWECSNSLKYIQPTLFEM